MTVAELFEKGGPVVWVLAFYSVMGLAIVLERYVYLVRSRRPPADLVRHVAEHLGQSEGLARSRELDDGPEVRVVRAMVEASRRGVSDLQAVGERVRDEELQRMEIGLRTLGILGNTAPLLGLLGTISGMIKAFMVLEQAGGKVDAQALAGGIWEAMITTGVGLAVAIPLLILLHFLEGAVARRSHSMQNCIALLLERRPGTAKVTDEVDEALHWEEITDGV